MERGKKGNSPVSTPPPTGKATGRRALLGNKATGRRALLGNGERGGHKGWESIVKKQKRKRVNARLRYNQRSIAIQSRRVCSTKSTSLSNKVDEFV